MSLLPLFFDEFDDWDISRPSILRDQHFGVGITRNDLLSPYLSKNIRRLASCPYYRPWSTRAQNKDEGSLVKLDNNNFHVKLDVQQFSPEEITVKTTDDNVIVVEGKHEEKEDEHGVISRHFIRKYVLPKGHDISRTKSELSSDGILTVSAPKIEREESKHREIPVIKTGKPSEPIEDRSEKDSCENGESMECEKQEPKRRKR